MTRICVNKVTTIGADSGLLPGRRKAIIWANAEILLIGSLGTNFSEILVKIQTFHSEKCIWKCRLVNGSHFVLASMCWHIVPHITMRYWDITRTTRTPAFWGYPLPPRDYPYLTSSFWIPSPCYWSVHIGSQVKRWKPKKLEKFAKKFKFYNFVITLTHNTPSNGSHYLWQIWK